MVAEGVRTTAAALALGARHGVELPIAAQMSAVLDGPHDGARGGRALMLRPQRRRRITLIAMGFFDKFKPSLTRTKEQFVERFDAIVAARRRARRSGPRRSMSRRWTRSKTR